MPERDQDAAKAAPQPAPAARAAGAARPGLPAAIGNRAMGRVVARMETADAVDALSTSLAPGVLGAEQRVADTMTAYSHDTKGFGEVAKRGGTAKGIPVKLGAADATAQVLEIQAMKPDFILMHGHTPLALLMKRTMNQYGLKIPTATIAHIGVPSVYQALGAGNTADMYFVSCFAPGSSDDAQGVKEMLATAAKYGHGPMSEDISFAAGWFAGHMVADGIRRAGPEPTRSKLVAGLNTKLTIDTGGVTSPVSFSPDNKAGTQWPQQVQKRTGITVVIVARKESVDPKLRWGRRLPEDHLRPCGFLEQT